MSASIGKNLKVTVFGQSHSLKIGAVIDGLPSGIALDMEYIEKFMTRRAPGQFLSTPRKEGDKVNIIAGLNDKGLTCGSALVIEIENTNAKSGDYQNLVDIPRPSHADYTSLIKNGEGRDLRGGGQFSGRLTAPLCAVGAICKSLLKEKGIEICAHLLSVGNAQDKSYNDLENCVEENLPQFPVLTESAKEEMINEITCALQDGDSVGAVIECKIVNSPCGVGEPMFDSVESVLAKMLFSVPAVKGFEIGAGFSVSKKRGSENNDELIAVNGKIATKTNNDGGVNGGITNGMPIVFKVAVKPTPSISKTQNTVNIKSLEQQELNIVGRHDPCIGVRIVPVIEACAAIVMYDMLNGK